MIALVKMMKDHTFKDSKAGNMMRAGLEEIINKTTG